MIVDMHLFPYDLIAQGSRIILYGAGRVGKEYYAQLMHNQYTNIIRWVDKEYLFYRELGLDVSSPDIDYSCDDYDYIVVAIESKETFIKIRSFLLGHNVKEQSIIWVDSHVNKEYIECPQSQLDNNEKHYSIEKNIQILISLLKKKGISKVVASPGTTNICFVASILNDDFFDVYSCVDERSAAYIACGLADETGEPVVLSCTGATASRNYYSGLTEAYYRKLPILALTSSQYFGNVGNLIPQNTDRSNKPSDIAVYSLQQKMVKNELDEWLCSLNMNKALSELERNGGGPVHINIETEYSDDYSVTNLPDVRLISRITVDQEFPEMGEGKIAILVGSHKKWTRELTKLVDLFCEKYNSLVFCNWNSNYPGKYSIFPSLICRQENKYFDGRNIDILIHIGEVSDEMPNGLNCKNVWRVSPDGEMRDYYKSLSYVFEMSEEYFFSHYSAIEEKQHNCSFFECWNNEYFDCLNRMPELPFSNIWCAQQMYNSLPDDCVVHLGIMNTNRSWSLFKPEKFVTAFSNTGGFGIDGGVSSLIGMSFSGRHRLYLGIYGDLAFFYDLNSIGNRHIKNNIRIMIINNGRGGEFRLYWHPWDKFGNEADKYGAAAGHFGNMSRALVKHYAEDLGFEYMTSEDKEGFNEKLPRFLCDENDKPIIFEVFVDYSKDSESAKQITKLTFG